MSDVYFMNKFTGELLPSSEAIRDFYKTHGIRDSWTDEWTETKMETGEPLAMPNFANAIRA